MSDLGGGYKRARDRLTAASPRHPGVRPAVVFPPSRRVERGPGKTNEERFFIYRLRGLRPGREVPAMPDANPASVGDLEWRGTETKLSGKLCGCETRRIRS